MTTTNQQKDLPENICEKLLRDMNWDLNDLEDLKINHGWTFNGVLRASINGYKTPDEVKKLELWSRRYLCEGHLWGNDPSPTAKILAKHLGPARQPTEDNKDDVTRVLEVGFGYGRDLKYLAETGYFVHGVEQSIIGLNEALATISNTIREEQVSLGTGSFRTAQLNDNFFHAAMGHRYLHQVSPEHIQDHVERYHNVLLENGILVLSARNKDDFNPDQMEMIDADTAKYNDPKRNGHFINFWTPERFKKEFGDKFEIVALYEGQEIESQSNRKPDGSQVMTSFTTAVMRRRSAGEQPQNAPLPEVQDLPELAA